MMDENGEMNAEAASSIAASGAVSTDEAIEITFPHSPESNAPLLHGEIRTLDGEVCWTSTSTSSYLDYWVKTRQSANEK
jgi:hypothetical protein